MMWAEGPAIHSDQGTALGVKSFLPVVGPTGQPIAFRTPKSVI